MSSLIAKPGKIVCVGLNYRDHAFEQNKPIPTTPMLFSKSPDSIINDGETITFARANSSSVDYEGELALLIGSKTRNISVDDALNAVAGFTIANDVSARDAQALDGQFFRAKSFDTFCPLGPRLVTLSDIGDPQNLPVVTRVNGEVRQNSTTADMIFSVAEVISYCSQFFTLEIGDLLLTGTPAGVGAGMNPPVFLEDGDVVEITIGDIGTLTNHVAVT